MADEFVSKLNELSKRINETKNNVKTEEATKMSFIMPFFQILGYDIFNSSEFVPEFTADVGTKKDEKVDYAIIKNGNPIIIIEAKNWTDNLNNHLNQLYRYFSVTSAKFAILTNGIEYRFYTDLEETNKMDKKPFLTFSLLDLKDNLIPEIKKFKKEKFNVGAILTIAEELKYSNNILSLLNEEFTNTSDDFVKYILSYVYDGVKTQNIIEKFKPIIKKTFSNFVNELINEKLKTAFEENAPKVELKNTIEEVAITTLDNKIITTQEELESYYIIKGILSEFIDSKKIVFKDTETYFGILYENNVRKWICRLYLSDNRKAIVFPENNGKISDKIYLNSLEDLYKYKDKLIFSCNRFIKNNDNN